MKANGTFTGFFAFLMLLATFGFTAFRYFAIALSTGFLDLAHLVGIWAFLVFSAKLSAVASYAAACVCGILLTFPLSLFVNATGKGYLEFTDGSAFLSMISHWIVMLWIIEYVAVALIAQFAMRFLWRGLNAKDST